MEPTTGQSKQSSTTPARVSSALFRLDAVTDALLDTIKEMSGEQEPERPTKQIPELPFVEVWKSLPALIGDATARIGDINARLQGYLGIDNP